MASKVRQQCCVCVNASAHKQILHATCSKGGVEGAWRRPAKLLMMGHVRTSVVKERKVWRSPPRMCPRRADLWSTCWRTVP